MVLKSSVFLLYVFVGSLLLTWSSGRCADAFSLSSSTQPENAASHRQAHKKNKENDLCSDYLKPYKGLEIFNCPKTKWPQLQRDNKTEKSASQLALSLLENSAKWGSAESQYKLGKIFYEGKQPYLNEPDFVAAQKWLSKASVRGNVDAQLLLGKFYYSHKSIVLNKGHNYRMALRQFELAAEQGNTNALLYISEIYRSGKGVDADLSKSFSYLETAAKQGSVIAQHGLYLKYVKGEGVNLDNKKGIYWLKRAANQNHLESSTTLANNYFRGRYVSQDKDKALFWAEKSLKISDSPILRAKVKKIKQSLEQDAINFTASLFKAFVKGATSFSASSPSASSSCRERALQQISDCSVSYNQEFGTGEVYNIVINCRGGKKARACERKLEWLVEVRLLDEYYAYCDLEDRDNWDADKDKVINRICSK